MKNFYSQNYYELLEVSPQASLDEITSAYHQALEAFNRDSVAVYSLFEDQERESLLERVKTAYRTLSNSRTRREYDHQLMAQGVLPPESFAKTTDPEDDKAPPEPREEFTARPRKVHRPLTPLVKGEGVALELAPGQILTGSDLKRLRESRGVTLREMSERTKIGEDTLLAIETDLYHRLPAKVYVKGFLKAYAQVLLLDAEAVCQAYLAGMGG